MNKELAISIILGEVLGTPEQTHEAVKMAVKALSQPDVPDRNVGDTISRQAAIDALTDYWDGIKSRHQTLDGEMAVYADCKGIIKRLPSTQPEQRWIPVSERLPEDKKAVYWVCNDNGHQFECRWTNTNHFWTELTTDWHWNIFDVPQYSKVVAWMPMPEPYKEKEDETD